MATTDISADLTATLSFDCSDRVLTVTDGTDYASAGTSRADVKVNFVLTYKPSNGDQNISLVYNEDTVTSFDIPLLNSGYHRILMTVAQDTENVKSAITGSVSVTNNDASVTGSGTAFTSELSDGDTIQIGGELYVVGNIINNTQLTLTSNYNGVTGSGFTAYLVPVFTGSLNQPFWIDCDYQECLNDKVLNIAQNYSCGCEPATEVIDVEMLRQLIAATEYKFQTQQDYAGAQKIAEEIELLCNGNCCS